MNDIFLHPSVYEQRGIDELGFGNPVCMFAADKPRWEQLSEHAQQQIMNYCDEQRLQNPHFGTRAEQQFVHTAINQHQRPGGTAESAITLSTDSEEDEPPPPSYFHKLRKGVSKNKSFAAAQPAQPAQPAARRVSKRPKKHPDEWEERWRREGGYQDIEAQKKLAAEERQEYAHLLEVRTDEYGGRGLFAKRDLNVGDIQLSYFGKHYAGESFYLKDYPKDDAKYGMQLNDEFYDGIGVDGLMRYVNHSLKGKNAEFVDLDMPFVQLVLTKRVRAGHQILLDYGKDYNYKAHTFTRE